MEREMLNKIEELEKLLKFFKDIKEPIYTIKDCPFKKINKHYELSEITSGQGCWRWDCCLCGKTESE